MFYSMFYNYCLCALSILNLQKQFAMASEIIINGHSFFIPDFLSPCKSKIENRAKDYERNVFVMIKYREENLPLRKYIKRTLKDHGLNCIYADDPEWKLTSEVHNPLAVLYCCKYGIAVFDKPDRNQLYNPNVAYELGIMHFQGKEVLLLIDSAIAKNKPFDIMSKMHKLYKDSLEIEGLIKTWIDENNITSKTTTAIVPLSNNRSVKHIAVAIVKKGGKFLVTERLRPEGKFKFGFPARELSDEDMSSEKFIKAALEKECYTETNITITSRAKIGERIHPNTGVHIQYWVCDYISGRRRLKATDELKSVEWMTAEELETFFEIDIYKPVKKLINS